MITRLASLALVLIIGGTVFAGVPLSNEQECSMPGMAGMDCCLKASQVEGRTPEISTARLACALYCSQNGATGVTESQLPQPSANQASTICPANAKARLEAFHLTNSLSWADSPPPYSHPAYIRHLALLI